MAGKVVKKKPADASVPMIEVVKKIDALTAKINVLSSDISVMKQALETMKRNQSIMNAHTSGM